MKKILFLALLIAALCCMPAEAKDAFYGTVIEKTRLDDAPTSVTSDWIDISQYDKVAFWVIYTEVLETGGVSVNVTLEVSYDASAGSELSAHFYDYAHPATLQTTESLAATANYYCWWNQNLNMRYVRVKVAGVGTDANDYIDVTVNYSAQK